VNAEIFLVRRQQSGGDAKYYWRLYVEGLQYGRDCCHASKYAECGAGLNLPKTDVQLADEIGLVAVQLLIVRWHETPSHEAPLLQAVTCARFIVSKSPSCAHAHFLLIRLHRLLGAGTHLCAIMSSWAARCSIPHRLSPDCPQAHRDPTRQPPTPSVRARSQRSSHGPEYCRFHDVCGSSSKDVQAERI